MPGGKTLQIRGSYKSLLPPVVAFSLAIAVGVWLAFGADFGKFERIVGYGCLCIFGPVSAYFFWLFLTAHRVVVTVSPQGFQDTRVSRLFVPWDAVRGYRPDGFGPFASVWLTIDPSRRKEFWSGPTGWIGRMSNWGIPDDYVVIPTLGLDIDPDSLAQAMWVHVHGDKERQKAIKVVRFYRQIGFFSGRKPADVIRQYEECWGRAPGEWDDALLLAFDKEQAWTNDPETKVASGSMAYVEALKEWARISQGAFAPSEVSEFWESESGPITLRFQLNGQPVAISPQYLGDDFDATVSEQINPFIAASGRQFEVVVDDIFALVVCLTKSQKAAMLARRNFPFAGGAPRIDDS